MSPILRRLVDKVVKLREGETGTALLMFAYSFLAMSAYNIVQPVTRSKFITSLGADNLPYVQLVAGVLIGLVMQGYSRAVTKLPRRWVIPVTQAGEAALLVAFWLMFRADAAWASAALYVFGLMLGILLISQFWTLANDIYDARQAKRLFGFIGGGASLGGVMGASLIAVTVTRVGTNNLLLVSAAMLGACASLVWVVVRREQVTSDLSALGERGVGGGEAIRLLRSSRPLQVIALVITCAALGAAVIDQQLNMAAASIKGAASTDAITQFLAQVRLYVSAIGFVVQVALTSRIHRSLGLLVALLVLPVSLGSTAVVILATGMLWAPAAARVLDSSLRYTIDKTTREVLFLPLPTDVKYRAKPFVDVTVDRLAKAIGALLLVVLIKPWGLHLSWQRLSYASLAITALWIVMAVRARGEYLAAFKRSLEGQAIAPPAVRPGVADAATIEALVEELANPDESALLGAIDMLEAFDKGNLVSPLLLRHESPRVRARALRALETSGGPILRRWTPTVERLLADSDADVRAAAVHALSTLFSNDGLTLMRQLLTDSDPRVAVAAAVALAQSGDQHDMEAADATLRRFVDDARDGATPGRKETAAGLAHVRKPRFHPLLIQLMSDHDEGVALEAIASIGALGAYEPLFGPGLIAHLSHRRLKRAARDVLVGYGEAAIEPLAHFLHDTSENVWVRRHIPATLARIPTERSMRALVDALETPDGFLRHKIIAAVETLRRDQPELVLPAGMVERLVLEETLHYCKYLALRDNLVRGVREAPGTLLMCAVDEKLERTLDRTYRLLGLLYPSKDVAAARQVIAHGDSRARARGLELLDNLLSGVLRRRVMPIVDDSPLHEKVRHANHVLRSRPRDVEETFVQLIHDDDPIVAASAIQIVGERRTDALVHDLEFVITNRTTPDDPVREAAVWALAASRRDEGARSGSRLEPLPAVAVVDRLRKLPLFAFVSVDELFRIARLGRQEHYEPGRELGRADARSDQVQFLLEGAVRLEGANGAAGGLEAPAALGFDEVLQGRPLRHGIHAIGPVVSVTIARDELLTMLSNSVMLAQGLFRSVLGAPDLPRRFMVASPEPPEINGHGGWVSPIDRVRVLRRSPLCERATADQLLDLAAIAREVPLAAGAVLFSETHPPAIYHVLDGEVQIDSVSGDAMCVGRGGALGIAETLVGTSFGRRAIVTREGRGLRLDRDELFQVLVDHLDLLQGIFGEIRAATSGEAASAGALSVA